MQISVALSSSLLSVGVNEYAPVFIQLPFAVTIQEDVVGLPVATFSARDTDAGLDGAITYTYVSNFTQFYSCCTLCDRRT